jgi:nucleoside phosphorylase
VALPLEARPWIDALALRRAPNLGRWDVFYGAGHHLIVSGVGHARAAAAVGAACAIWRPRRLLSFGLAGAPEGVAAPGDIRLIHGLHDATTGRAFYPDVLEKHPFAEAVATTWPRRVRREDAPSTLVDMEAAGVWTAASSFLPPHRIYLLKVVSDTLQEGDLDRAQLSAWLREAVATIAPWWQALAAEPARLPTPPPELSAQVAGVAEAWRLSTTEAHRLEQATEDYWQRHGRLPAAWPTQPDPVRHRREGKTRWQHLHGQLLAE